MSTACAEWQRRVGKQLGCAARLEIVLRPEIPIHVRCAPLSKHTATLAFEYARQARDWEDVLQQRAKELALMSQIGLALPCFQCH